MAVRIVKTNPVITEDTIAHLPDPVRRYVRYTGLIGMAPIITCRLTYSAQFRTGRDARWLPMQATQVYRTDAPAFLWKARFTFAGIPFMVGKDSYMHGAGHMKGKLLGLFTLFDERGAMMNQGSMMRYFNEMMWFPTALLGENVTWSPVDAHQAEATFSDCGETLSARFVFDDDGRLVNFVAERYSADTHQPETWSTPIQGYGTRAGLHLPVDGTGIWNLPDEDFPYIKLHIKEVAYNVPVPELE
jgi:hypothetical protein